MGQEHVLLNNVSKKFGTFQAVSQLTLSIEEGAFVTLLGPSGCGKTTTLRMLAGFYDPDEGDISFHGALQQGIPPDKRETAIVFQEYALFPHMNVFGNVSYGLRIRHLGKEEIQRRVDEVLDQVGLRGLHGRFPYELSGGQQQRVALARSLIMKPRILLMDEPLSNLDAKLRISVRREIKQLQSQLQITTIYVTHDQEEALSLSDKIAVMNEGRLIQVGSAQELYARPINPWVANFVGTANLIEGEIGEQTERGTMVRINGKELLVEKTFMEGQLRSKSSNTPMLFMIRPEWVLIGPAVPSLPGADLTLIGSVLSRAFLGSFVRYWARVEGIASDLVIDDYQSRIHGILSGEIAIGMKQSDLYVFPSTEGEKAKINHPSMVI